MATDDAVQRYRAWYATVLRLYPRPFRERFGEGMAQTFHDLCREQQGAQWGLRWLALWVFLETSAGIVKENITHMPEMGKTVLRVAGGALAALMVPLVASRVVKGWNWNPGAFVFVYVLFFATGMAFALIARRMNIWSYKAGVGLALAAGFGLGWSTMVHVADAGGPVHFVYYSVLVVGLVGAFLSRLKAQGLAYTLFAMAAIYGLIALILPSVAPSDVARNIAFGHGIFMSMLIVSGLLFRHASLEGLK